MRHAFLAFATLAVVMRLLIPAGFMPSTRVNDLPFPLVICTGHGELVVAAGQAIPDGPNAPGGSEEPGNQTPCVFSGAVAAPLSAGPALLTSVSFEYRPPPERRLVTCRGGPGITGPPLPARGPPSLTI